MALAAGSSLMIQDTKVGKFDNSCLMVGSQLSLLARSLIFPEIKVLDAVYITVLSVGHYS